MLISFFVDMHPSKIYSKPSELLLMILNEAEELAHAARDRLVFVRRSKWGVVLAVR